MRDTYLSIPETAFQEQEEIRSRPLTERSFADCNSGHIVMYLCESVRSDGIKFN